jgi:hypothetical protein
VRSRRGLLNTYIVPTLSAHDLVLFSLCFLQQNSRPAGESVDSCSCVSVCVCVPACRQVLGLAAVRATPVLTQRCRDIISTNLAIANGFFARWQAVFDWQEPQVRPRVLYVNSMRVRKTVCGKAAAAACHALLSC